jgi:hypothetical protein
MSASWSRSDKLAVLSLVIGTLLTILGYFAPEMLRRFGFDAVRTSTDLPTAPNTSAASSQTPLMPIQPLAKDTTEHVPRRRVISPAVTAEPRTAAPPRVTESRRHEITRSGGAKDIGEIVGAAEDVLDALRAQSHAARVRLRADQTAPDDTLQGLITTDLVLDVKLMDGTGSVNHSFTVTSRGGGFSSDASALQARIRLMSELRNRLGKEPS